MPSINALKDNVRELSAKALAVVEDASRPTSEKREELNRLEADIKAYNSQIADEEFLTEERKKYQPAASSEAAPTPGTPTRQGFKSLGRQFIESDGYKGLKERGMQGKWSTGGVELKALLTEDGASGGDLIVPDNRQGPIFGVQFRRLVVADLIPSGTTASTSITYPIETTATNAAATVAEGGTKPESTLVFDRRTDNVKKIATVLPVTDEMLEDFGQIRAYIDGRLTLFVQLTEEDQLLNGDGAGNNITGIRNRTGLQADQALGADTRPDAIYKMITTIRTGAFLEPDGIVVHPNDWQDIRLLKDANEQYYGGGPFTAAYGNSGPVNPGEMIWGLRVVVTPLITEGTALVGCFGSCAQVYRKGGITIEASNSHSTFFVENKTMIRAEERLGLAVYRPAGFGEVTGL